jgi:hypothetical protein
MKDPTLSVCRAVPTITYVFFLLIMVLSIPACADYWKAVKQAHEIFTPKGFTTEWREEVQLSDGRVIEITQKRRYEKVYNGHNVGNVVRDAWIIFRLPETNHNEVVWRERLIGMRFDVVDGKPFIVAYPQVGAHFIQYGKPKPPYLAYVYRQGEWHRLGFSEIPESQYDFNLVAEQVLPDGMTRLSLEEKNSKKFNLAWTLSKCAKRVNTDRKCDW